MIKAQALADFLDEYTIDNHEVGGQEDILQEMDNEKVKEYWVLYFDRSSKIKTSGAGIVLQNPDGFMIEYALKLNLPTTNNEDEQETLISKVGLA